MLQVIAAGVFISSLLGLVILIYRKIPILVKLPEISTPLFNWREKWFQFKNKPFWKKFTLESILHIILCKIRILTLKIDTKTAHWLQFLRQKIKKKKEIEKAETDSSIASNGANQDNYWQEIKKFKEK